MTKSTKIAKRSVESENDQATTQIATLPEPGTSTKEAISRAEKRVAGRLLAPKVSKSTEDAKSIIAPPHSDAAGWTSHLMDAFGTRSTDFATGQLSMLMEALRQKGEISESEINSAIAMAHGMEPANEMEAALAVQITVSHVISMRLLGKAAKAEFAPQLDSLINATTKLQRTMTAQIEALASVRRGGKQQVVVKHVHVHQGPNGQAIVGDVHHAGGPRGKIENGREPYGARDIGALAIEDGATLWGKDRRGSPCQCKAVKGKARCRIHGGAAGSGAPRGERHGSYKHGRYTCEAIEERRVVRELIRQAKATRGRL